MLDASWTDAREPVACIHLPRFIWQVEIQRCPDLEGRPVVVMDGVHSGSGRTVLDWSPGLTGVLPGMPVSEALSRNRGVVLLEPDMPCYERAFERILKALEERCPDVEDARLGTAFVGIWGLAKLYGSDAQIVRVLANSIRGFDLRIGVASNKWVSYIAAVGSERGRGRKVSGEPGRFMSRFPVNLLPVDYRTVQRLHSFGLHRMGDLAALPRGAVEAQFGRAGGLAWELANGIDRRPLTPRRSEESVSEYVAFPEATVSIAAIVPAIESLLARAYSTPQMARRYARQAALEAQVFRQPPWRLQVAFKEPAGSTPRALFSIKTKLDTVRIPGPLEDLRLTLSGLTGEAGRQESMWREVRRSQQLQETLSQLQARLGKAPPIYQVRELEPWSRIPERRHALVQLSS